MSRSILRFTCQACGRVDETSTPILDGDTSVTVKDYPNADYPQATCREWFGDKDCLPTVKAEVAHVHDVLPSGAIRHTHIASAKPHTHYRTEVAIGG